MSNDPDFEKRIGNKIETVVETQANLQEAIAALIQVERIQNGRTEENTKSIAGLIEVARLHEERLDRIEKQTGENSKQIAALAEQGKESREDLRQMKDAINALIRIVEGHLSNHP